MRTALNILFGLVLMGCSQVQNNDEVEENDKVEITLSEINEFLKPQIQTFNWSSKNDTIITCEKGTKVFFPKDCLDPASYDKSKAITIEIKECYKLSDFIGERLTTQSIDNILETGGMVHIEIKQFGNPVLLNEGSEYGILFPKTKESNKEMQTFYGAKNSNKNVIWSVDSMLPKQTTQITTLKPKELTECEFHLYSYTTGFDKDIDSEWVLSTSNERTPHYITKNLNPTKNQIEIFCETNGFARYNLWYNLDGSVKKIDIEQSVSASFDSLFMRFVTNMPPIKVTSLTKKYINRSYSIEFNAYPMSKFDNTQYSKAFKEKYSSIKDQIISKVNKAELDYYVISASKLGWINCDRFWETDDAKIDYLVEIENMEDVNLNLVFSDINSIMPATKIGDKYLFKNVPVGRKVKLIGIGYEGESVSLAVKTTIISKKSFHLSGFKNFKLSELEEELNSI